MPTRTIAYLRVSTEKQAERGVSLDAQRAKVAAYAELYDLELVETIPSRRGRGTGATRGAEPHRARVRAGAGEEDGGLI
jgi:DNA invertase Pin-like site-specific DNA recombinase